MRSLNGEPWRAGEPLEARCRLFEFAHWRPLRTNLRPHDAPHLKCTCGIYASKTLDLRWPGYQRSLIYGQVLLWGTIVEHQRGWRAQYAYPKSFLLPPEVLPVALKEIETRLETLISYGRDIFVLHDGARWPLWKKGGGMDTLGLDYLSDRARRWYTQRNQRSGIRQGDRIAVAGEGIAVVDQIDGTYIRAKLGKECARAVFQADTDRSRPAFLLEKSSQSAFHFLARGVLEQVVDLAAHQLRVRKPCQLCDATVDGPKRAVE